jgi:hypothetical protein
MPVDARLRIKRRGRRAGAVAGFGVAPGDQRPLEPLTAHRPADNGELRADRLPASPRAPCGCWDRSTTLI